MPSALSATLHGAASAGDLRLLLGEGRVRVAVAVMLLLVVASLALPRSEGSPDVRTLAAAIQAALEAWRGTFGPALLATVIAWLLGSAIGIAIAGSAAFVRDLLSSAIRGVGAIPLLLLVLACIAVAGVGAGSLVVAIAASQSLRYARDALAIVGREHARPYVEAARGLGVSRSHVWRRHVLPNCGTRVLLLPLAGRLRSAATAHASIAFLGLAPGTDSSLGGVIAQSLSPAHVAGAAVLLCVSLLALNVLAARIRAFGAAA